MIELLLLFPTVVLAFLLWGADRRYDEAEKAWRLERVGLLNRIQAPELAPILAAEEPSDELLYVPFEDDVAHDEYVEDRASGEVR